MNKNKLFDVTHVVLLFCVVSLTILNHTLNTTCETATSIFLLISTILLEIISMGYFIVQDIIDNGRKIAKHGSLSLFDTIDRKSIVKEVIQKISSNEHVIYIDCSELPDIEIENIKQRLYNDLSVNPIKIGKMRIKNVFMPTSLDMETFYKQIFYNRTSSANGNKVNIYIYDNRTANCYFIQQIEKKFKEYYDDNDFPFLDSIDKRKKKWAKNSYIVYLSDDGAENAIKTSIDQKELNDFVKNKLNVFRYIREKENKEECSQKSCKIKKVEEPSNISKVLVLDEILNDSFNREIIKNDAGLIEVLYNLKIGKYYEALSILTHQNEQAKEKLDLYKQYVIADTLHLLNCYANAITFCNSILGQLSNLKESKNKNKAPADKNDQLEKHLELEVKTIKLQAHIIKHIGVFDCSCCGENEIIDISSNQILDYLDTNDKEIKQFVYEKKTINHYFVQLQKLLKHRECAMSNSPQYYDDLIAHFATSKNPDTRMYYAAFLIYNNAMEADKCIDDIIEYYEKTNNRRRFNAYYIKAEVLRRMQRNTEAYQYYIRSSGIEDGHIDVNLLDQNYFSLKAMEKLELVNGVGSFAVKNYKARYFTPEGFLLDESRTEAILSQYPIVKKDEKSCLHQFNYFLLNYIDDENLTKEQLLGLFTENIFIIL